MSDDPQRTTRRNLLWKSVVAGTGLGLFATVLAWAKSLSPKVLYEPPTKRRLGPPDRFPEGRTYLSDERIFVLRKGNAYRAISAVCTHLGCTVGEGEAGGYHCPCHGSRFSETGSNDAGPAPRPLPWHPLTLTGGALVVDLEGEVGPDDRLEIAVEGQPQ